MAKGILDRMRAAPLNPGERVELAQLRTCMLPIEAQVFLSEREELDALRVELRVELLRLRERTAASPATPGMPLAEELLWRRSLLALLAPLNLPATSAEVRAPELPRATPAPSPPPAPPVTLPASRPARPTPMAPAPMARPPAPLAARPALPALIPLAPVPPAPSPPPRPPAAKPPPPASGSRAVPAAREPVPPPPPGTSSRAVPAAREPPGTSPRAARILDAVRSSSAPLSANAIAAAVGGRKAVVLEEVRALAQQGALVAVEGGFIAR